MRLKNWWCDDEGIVLALTALIMPVLLLFGVLLIQSGQLYQRHAELQFIARQAAASSLLPVSDLIVAQAGINRTQMCTVPEPPAVCDSNVWQDFLNQTELTQLLTSDDTYATVQEAMYQFLTEADANFALVSEHVQLEFPIFDLLQNVRLRLSIVEPQTNWLGSILNPEKGTLSAEAVVYLNLSP